jgi:mannose-1-phosphate guanylyltransferase/phosphomannomutase
MAYWNDVGDLDELRNTILDAVLGHVRVDVPGEEIAPGVWAEAGCRIDPSASLEGPIVLGPNVTVEASAQVRGPAAIGADCHVGKEGAIRRAALLPGSVVPDKGFAIAGIFGDASNLAESILRYPAAAGAQP